MKYGHKGQKSTTDHALKASRHVRLQDGHPSFPSKTQLWMQPFDRSLLTLEHLESESDLETDIETL